MRHESDSFIGASAASRRTTAAAAATAVPSRNSRRSTECMALELDLTTELEQPRAENLRRLLPIGAKRCVDGLRRAAVEEVVDIEAGHQAVLVELEVLRESRVGSSRLL